MKAELINNENKLLFLMLFFLFAIGVFGVGIEQPIELIIANKKVVTWINWIVLYLLAQFTVAVFIGRAIQGPRES